MYKGAEVGPFRVFGVKGGEGQGRRRGARAGVDVEADLPATCP